MSGSRVVSSVGLKRFSICIQKCTMPLFHQVRLKQSINLKLRVHDLHFRIADALSHLSAAQCGWLRARCLLNALSCQAAAL